MKAINTIVVLLVLLLSVHPAFARSITLVTLGDSLTQGDGDEEGGGYPPRLLNKLKTLYPGSTLRNLGQSGWTSDDLINTQLKPAVAALNAAPAASSRVVIVWIGSNDLFGLYNYVCDEEYRNNYAACERDGLRIFSDNIKKILTSLKSLGV